MKIIYFDARESDDKQLKLELSSHDVVALPDKLTIKNVDLASSADIISVFVTSSVSATLLNLMPRLKMIAARSAGVDHIDLSACTAKGMIVSNVPHYGERTVAEHTFALILALTRKIFQSYERTEKMNFDRAGLQGFDLKGRILGVVGTGNIGRNTIEIGLGFKMKIVAYDVKPDYDLAKKLNFKYVDSLYDLLSVSDIVSLHVPYMKETHHLINAENLQGIKQGAIIINTARGALVDTEALLASLNDGRLAGAGLDVLEEEEDAYDRIEFMGRERPPYEELMTLVRNHMLVARDDVIITPHNAFNSNEAIQRIFDTTVKNIKDFIKGSPTNIVST